MSNQENTPKYDFQNMDVKLYLALKAAYTPSPVLKKEELIRIEQNAHNVMEEFRLSLGPLPHWAVDRNWEYALIPGAQLCTKDGRIVGNAHIIGFGDAMPVSHTPTFLCLTDAGNTLVYSEVEILNNFNIGDWLSDPVDVIKRFKKEDVL
jgi:hypothetical protein